MDSQRIHRVTTSDGVTIAGSVHGAGPPLVFLQGAIGDGDLDWGHVLERGQLTDRFTCHLVSLRGRGLSSDHPDLSIDRLVEDVETYIDRLGRPVGLTGWSLGAGLSLLVAARSDAVAAVAPLDPLAVSRMDDQERMALVGAVGRAAELAAGGEEAEAVRAFAAYPFAHDDIAMAERLGYFDASGRYVARMVDFFRQQAEHSGPMPDAPEVLGAITAPTLVLHGSDTSAFGILSARHIATQIRDARLHEIEGAGHAATLTHPTELAETLAEFFTESLRNGRSAVVDG